MGRTLASIARRAHVPPFVTRAGTVHQAMAPGKSTKRWKAPGRMTATIKPSTRRPPTRIGGAT